MEVKMMTALRSHTEGMDLATPNARRIMAKALMNLFGQWGIDNNSQLNLLGLSSNSRSLLNKYREGEKGLPTSRDVTDRVGWLLAIHKALRLLFPHNEQLRISWVTRRNAAFDNRTPLEFMTERGIIGLANVSRYLDYQRGR
jgi:hypothetical protein